MISPRADKNMRKNTVIVPLTLSHSWRSQDSCPRNTKSTIPEDMPQGKSEPGKN